MHGMRPLLAPTPSAAAGWQMNITARLMDYSIWKYDYSAASCKLISSTPEANYG